MKLLDIRGIKINHVNKILVIFLYYENEIIGICDYRLKNGHIFLFTS